MLTIFLRHEYFLLAGLAILEGPVLAVLCGFASALGYLNPFAAYGVLICGEFATDVAYWSIGHWGVKLQAVRRLASHSRLLRENLLPLEQLWRKDLLKTVATVKLAYGIVPPFLVSAGMSGVPLGSFLARSIGVSLLYFGALMGLGYGLAQIYGRLGLVRHSAEIILGIVGVAIFGLLAYLFRYARRRMNIMRARRESNIVTES